VVEVSLNGKTTPVTRPKLQKWLAIEKLRDKVIESANKKDDSGFVSGIYAFLLALVSVSEDELDTASWYEVLDAYYLSSLENAVHLDLSIIHSSKKEHENGLPDVWEYDERVWYSWVHLLAKSYGWNVEYIAQLDVDDALALVQEISLEEQFDKEWSYSLSEVAYEYDTASKKSKLRTLPRPSWMNVATQAVKEKIESGQTTRQVHIPKSFIPPGIVVVNGQPTNSAKFERDDAAISDST